MSGSVNKVILVGNMTAAPDIKVIENGRSVANFTVATSERWRDRSTGETRERAEFHRVVVWNEGLIKVVENYLIKGSKIYIEGQLQTRKWQDQSGKDRYSTEVVLKGYDAKLVMLGRSKTGRTQDINSDQDPSRVPKRDYGANMNDDIPF